MSTKKPIRFSTWTLVHKRNKNDERVARKIVVTGNEEDIPSIKTNSLYLGWVFRDLFGKKSFIKKRKDDQYIILKVELDDKILGYSAIQEKE